MNSNSKTKFEFKQRRRKEKQKKKKREEASLWPRPAWLHGPASNRPAPPARSSRPAHELAQAQQPSRTPLTPTRLPAFACSRCHTGPACQPSCSSSPRHAPDRSRRFPSPTEPRQHWQGRARGSRSGHGPVPLALRPRNHSRPLDAARASDRP